MIAFVATLYAIALLLFPFSSFAAEAAKFQYAFSVYADDRGIGLNHPEGISCNDQSLMVIGDTGNDRLLKFTYEAKNLKAGKEIKIPQLTNPIRVQINSKGDIFALDGKQRRIVRLDPEGTFKGYVAPEGMPSVSAMIPRSVKIDREDNIYILDVFSARVVVLSADGKYQKQIGFPKDNGFISDLAVDSKGTVLLIDSERARVYSAAKTSNAFAPLGASLKEYLSFPVSLTTDNRGVIYVTDTNGASIGILAQDGSFLGKQLTMGWTEGLLYYPSQACINEKGEIFIADRGNSRVQIFMQVK
jgi:hypothetical protein